MSRRRELGHFDVAIVGAGFAGLLLARILTRRGRRVVALDRARHPRFAFGESSTPLLALLLERIARREGLPDLHHLATWGRWRRALPELRVGLKRGFTFYHHQKGQPYTNDPRNSARLLVAASPDDELADVHHHRGDVDAMLANRAVAEGLVLFEQAQLEGVEVSDRGARVSFTYAGEQLVLGASWVVDASGCAGAVARRLGARAADSGLDTGFVGSHLRGWPTLESLAPSQHFGGAPYPEERAAVHHLVEDGWMWVLPFDEGTTSVGLVVDRGPSLAALRAGEPAEKILAVALDRHPELAAAVAGSHCVATATGGEPSGWLTAREGAHRLDCSVGEGWIALPQTFAFADPMFSTGLAWSTLGVERVVEVLEGGLEPHEYQRRLALEATRITSLIQASQATRPSFPAFIATALAYFATVSWTEIGSRLDLPGGRLECDLGFLGVGDEVFDRLYDGDGGAWPGLSRAAARLAAHGHPQSDVEAYRSTITALLAPRDLVGVDLSERLNLHPVDLELLVSRCSLVGLDRAELTAMLPRLRGC